MNDIYEGLTFDTHMFGNVSILRMRCDGDQLFADCRSMAGEALFLSTAYIRKLIGSR